MKKGVMLVLLLFVGVFVIGMGSAWEDNGSAYQEVNGCGEMNVTGAVYSLVGNLTDNSTADCLTIGADDITINGNGYSVSGNINASNPTPEASAYTNFVLNNLTIEGNILSVGSAGGAFGGSGGNIFITNSYFLLLDNSGGSGYNQDGQGGNGGVIYLSNFSLINSIISNGGSGDYGGSGGELHITNTNINISNVAIDISAGEGPILNGSVGKLFLTYNVNFTDTNVSYGEGIKLKINYSGVGVIDLFGNVVDTSGITNLSSLFVISYNNISLDFPIDSIDAQIIMSLNISELNLFNSLINKNGIIYGAPLSRDSVSVYFYALSQGVYNAVSTVIHLFPVANSTSASRTFIYNVSDDSAIANCSLVLPHDTVNNTNLTAINVSENNNITYPGFGHNSLPVGSYTAYINCTDAYGFVGQSNTIAFTVAAVSAGTTSGSSGGSSGSVVRTIASSIIANGFTSNYRGGDSIKFDIKNQTHTLKVNSLTNGVATVTVQSEPQVLALSEGDIKDVDLENDGVYDLQVSFVKYYTTGIASIKVQQIEKAYNLPVEDNVNNDTLVDDIVDLIDGDKESESSNLALILSILLVVLFIGAIVGYVVWYLVRRRRFEILASS